MASRSFAHACAPAHVTHTWTRIRNVRVGAHATQTDQVSSTDAPL